MHCSRAILCLEFQLRGHIASLESNLFRFGIEGVKFQVSVIRVVRLDGGIWASVPGGDGRSAPWEIVGRWHPARTVPEIARVMAILDLALTLFFLAPWFYWIYPTSGSPKPFSCP
jgi:hypothetical protein